VDTDDTPKTQRQLKAEGWKIATVTGGASLDRILEMYRELGLQVYLEEVKPEQCEGCTQCFTESKEAVFRIYTRQSRS
jgi:phosphoserine phosphatase